MQCTWLCEPLTFPLWGVLFLNVIMLLIVVGMCVIVAIANNRL